MIPKLPDLKECKKCIFKYFAFENSNFVLWIENNHPDLYDEWKKEKEKNPEL